MARKAVTLAIPATGANANSGRTVMPTPDDAVIRHVVGVSATLATKGMEFTFDLNSAPQVVIDALTLSRYTVPLPVAYDVPTNVQISFSLQNTTGGGLVAGDFVTVVYEV